MKICIRDAAELETKPTAAILAEFTAREAAATGRLRDVSAAEFETFLKKEVVFVAEKAGEIVGMIRAEARSDEFAEIGGVWVDEKFRRHGIGTQLFRAVLDRVHFDKRHGMLLTQFPVNVVMIRLGLKFDFVPVTIGAPLASEIKEAIRECMRIRQADKKYVAIDRLAMFEKSLPTVAENSAEFKKYLREFADLPDRIEEIVD